MRGRIVLVCGGHSIAGSLIEARIHKLVADMKDYEVEIAKHDDEAIAEAIRTHRNQQQPHRALCDELQATAIKVAKMDYRPYQTRSRYNRKANNPFRYSK